MNLEEEFDALIDEFAASYQAGRTPNPCIECNRRFKMGSLLELAEKLGAVAVATGHYARIRERNGRLAIERAADGGKDQSYVLFPLEQDVLRRTRFPLGDLTKDEVRAEARRLGLRTAEKAESMDICFVPTGDYRDVLRQRIPGSLKGGNIVDRDGSLLGTHDGTALFTIGQRRGLPGGQEEPLYVTAIDPVRREVTVGRRDELLSTTCIVGGIVWSGADRSAPGCAWEGDVKIRHRHPGAPGRVTALSGDRVQVDFHEPQAAVTPGQAAVLYDEGRVLLGGWIEDRGREV